jgi:hypothetical protein
MQNLFASYDYVYYNSFRAVSLPNTWPVQENAHNHVRSHSSSRGDNK